MSIVSSLDGDWKEPGGQKLCLLCHDAVREPYVVWVGPVTVRWHPACLRSHLLRLARDVWEMEGRGVLNEGGDGYARGVVPARGYPHGGRRQSLQFGRTPDRTPD